MSALVRGRLAIYRSAATEDATIRPVKVPAGCWRSLLCSLPPSAQQLRTTNRDAVVAELHSIAVANAAAGLRFYVAEPHGGWLPVFPNFRPELERVAKSSSASADCLIVLLLSADEDDLYCMFFQMAAAPWLRLRSAKAVAARSGQTGRQGGSARRGVRRGKPRTTSCGAGGRDSCDLFVRLAAHRVWITGIHNAFTSFDYLQRGEREGLDPQSEPELVC